jgi:hypothetical protein
MGRRLAYTYEVREHAPGDRFVMSTAQGPFPMETTYGFEDAPGGTRMTLRNRGEPSGFAKVGAPLMERAMRVWSSAMVSAVRVARHTERLDEIVAFYRDGLGLEEIGGFRDHDGYDGVSSYSRVRPRSWKPTRV